jgi:predicted dehydrogenase
LAAERPDLVCVCTGNDEHAAPTLAALGAGAHVLVEKPMAFRLEEARAMAEAAEAAGLAFGVNFNHRFSAGYAKALAFVRQGPIGAPAYLDMKFAGDLYTEWRPGCSRATDATSPPPSRPPSTPSPTPSPRVAHPRSPVPTACGPSS